MWSGTLKQAIQPAMKASGKLSVLVLFKGKASSQWEERPTTVKRWLKPSFDQGRGLTMQVHVNLGELPHWDGHLLQGGAQLSGHLGPLTELAVPSPLGDVCGYALHTHLADMRPLVGLIPG